MQNTSHEMLVWMTHKLESRLPREISTTSDMQVTGDTTFISETKEELKSLLMKVKEETGLKLNIKKTKIMASSPVTS